MYDLLNDAAGRERHQSLLDAAENERRTRKVENAHSKSGMLTQVRTAVIKTISTIIR